MTAANGIDRGGKHAAPAVWNRGAANVVMALRTLIRPVRAGPHVPWLRSPRRLLAAAAVFGAVILLGMVFVDAPAAQAARRLPRGVIVFFDTITDYGKSGWFLWPLGILFLMLAALPPSPARFSRGGLGALMVRVGFLFLAIGVPGLFVTTVKRMIGRARPMVTGEVDPFAFSPFIWRSDFASLPSGHTTTAFSVLVAFGVLWPRARPVLLFYALMIAASRIVLTAHYPTDVLAGAVVGSVGALMVRRWFALRGLGFAVGPDGVTHRFPGPSPTRIKGLFASM